MPRLTNAGKYIIYYRVNAKNYYEYNGNFEVNIAPKPIILTADDKIMQKITEIKEWIAQNGREPQKGGSLKEKLMYASLTTLKEKGLWT